MIKLKTTIFNGCEFVDVSEIKWGYSCLCTSVLSLASVRTLCSSLCAWFPVFPIDPLRQKIYANLGSDKSDHVPSTLDVGSSLTTLMEKDEAKSSKNSTPPIAAPTVHAGAETGGDMMVTKLCRKIPRACLIQWFFSGIFFLKNNL